MTVKRKSKKILTDYQLSSAYKKTFDKVIEPWMLNPEFEKEYLLIKFEESYKSNWAYLFKFNTDRKLFIDEQENLNNLVYADIHQCMKRIWNPHTNWDNCPFTGSAS